MLMGTAKSSWLGGLLKLSRASFMFLLEKLAKLTTLTMRGEVLLVPVE